jgi:chromosome segregation ATPase
MAKKSDAPPKTDDFAREKLEHLKHLWQHRNDIKAQLKDKSEGWTKEIGELKAKLDETIESGQPETPAKAVKQIRKIQKVHQAIAEAVAGKKTEVHEFKSEIEDLDDKINAIILNPDQMELFPFKPDAEDPMAAVREAAANMGVPTEETEE